MQAQKIQNNGKPKILQVTCKAHSLIELDELTPLQGDLKELNKKQFEKLKLSILENGISFPFFIWQNKKINFTLDGHQRDKVLHRLRDEGYKIPPLPIALIEAKNEREAKKKILLQSSTFGKMTDSSLTKFIQSGGLEFPQLRSTIELPQIRVDWHELGFTSNENFLESTPKVEKQKELQEKWQVKKGDLWQLPSRVGEPHLIMCGDSSDPKQVQKLLKGKKIDLICTDPPYEMNGEQVANCADSFGELMVAVCGSSQGYQLAHLWNFRFDFIWLRNHSRSYPSLAMPQILHANILILTKTENGKTNWKRPTAGWPSTIKLKNEFIHIDATGQGKNSLLFFEMMRGFQKAENIADPFCGTGAVPLACEQKGARCFAMEIDPCMVAVSLDRWQSINPAQAPHRTH